MKKERFLWERFFDASIFAGHAISFP